MNTATAFYCALSLAATQGRCPAPPSPPLPLSRARAAPAVRSAVQRAPFFTVYMELSGVACRSSSYIPPFSPLATPQHHSRTAHLWNTTVHTRTHTHAHARRQCTHPTHTASSTRRHTTGTHTFTLFTHTHLTHARTPSPGPARPASGTQPAHGIASIESINRVGEHLDVVSVELA